MKIDRNMFVWIVIAILVILVVYTVFFQGSANSNVVASTGQAAGASYSGMVGGC